MVAKNAVWFYFRSMFTCLISHTRIARESSGGVSFSVPASGLWREREPPRQALPSWPSLPCLLLFRAQLNL